MKYLFLILSFLLLNTCSSQPPILDIGIEGRVVINDPDPMCHLKYSESRIEKVLSVDPFELYGNDYEVVVPYKPIQQRKLPRVNCIGFKRSK